MAGSDQRLKVFFDQYIRNPNRTNVINRHTPQLKDTLMVDQLLDRMLSEQIIISQGDKHKITGQGQGSLTNEEQGGKLLEALSKIDAKKYIGFLKILNENQGDLAETLTGDYHDLLSRGDLEEQLKKKPASLPPMAKESGKDYKGYIDRYIEKEEREKILQKQTNYIAKYLDPKQILLKLVSKNVISQDQKWEIEGAGTGFKVPKVQTQDLLRMLGQMDDEKYVDFLDALFTTQKDIARMLTGGEYIKGEDLKGYL